MLIIFISYIPGRPDYWDDAGDYKDIVSFATGGAGVTHVEVIGHLYVTGDLIEITDNAYYGGEWEINYVSVDLFSITKNFSSTGTGKSRKVTFRKFEDYHASFFGVAPTIDTVLDYSGFPVDKRVTVDVVTYGLTGNEDVINVVTDFSITASFTTLLRAELDTVLLANAILVATTANDASTISFEHSADEFNGTHFRYTLKDELTDTDLTETYNDIITINRDFEHSFFGARPAKGFNWMSYWENSPNDGQANHHRFPPMNHFVNSFVASVPAGWQNDFGVTRGALLGLKMENIIIPSEIADKVQYMGIAYAKRNSENKMFFGDSLILNYHTTPDSNLHATPLNALLKDNFNPYADAAVDAGTAQSANNLYLDNFDILHNNARAKITDIVPEYSIDYESLIFNTYRCNTITPSSLEAVRGTMIETVGVRTTKSYASLAGYSDRIKVDFNLIIPQNAVVDPGVVGEWGEYFFNAFAFFDFSWNFGGRPKPVGGSDNLNSVDNTGGQKHIYINTIAAYDFSITAANPVALTTSTRTLIDDNKTWYAFTADSDLGDAVNDGFIQSGADIKIAVGSIYGIKDSVYIDPKAQEIIPCGQPIEVTGAGIYAFDMNDVGDCVISEKTTLFTGDPYINKIDNYVPTRAVLNSLSHADARNQLANNALGSSLVFGNKLSFNHLTYGVSDLSRRYREDTNDAQSDIILLDGKNFSAKEHNIFEPPTNKYSNDYNSLQDLDIPVFIEETPEFNLGKIIRGTNYKNEDIDISALKTFLVDDYYIMPGDKKGIIGISVMGDNLVIQQRYGLFYAFVKDYLNTQGANAYLGTGELFDRKPLEVRTGVEDSIACAHKMSATIFKYGYAVFDDLAKKLHVFNSEKVMTISDQDAKNYFRENYDFDGLEYNPLKSTGSGVRLYFDGMNGNLHIIKNVLGGTNNNLSFSFLINNFLSFHSWIPDYCFTIEDNLISLAGGNIFWKHNSPTKICRFYSDAAIEQSYIDIVFNGGEQHKNVSKLFESINWESQAIKLTDGTNVHNSTFDDILLYNDDQCSGYVSLADTDWFKKVKRSIIKTWTFNEFRDIVEDNLAPFFTDLEPNANVTPNMNWFNKSMFTGKHIVVRFRHNNLNQYSVIINNMNVSAKINKR